MASGNGTVDLFVGNVPAELRTMVCQYQYDRKLQSFRQAIIELLETHPSIAERVNRVYNEASSQVAHERV